MVSFAVFIVIGAAYWLLAGVLVANAWNAARLWSAGRVRHAAVRA
ncbi:MAG: hypothetical protein NTW72_14065 [Gemmatimonadetes bacterium]|nr:hypothetical protein [Gemmatimonadota bacterium]